MRLLRGAMPALLSCLFTVSVLADDTSPTPEDQVRQHIQRYVTAFNDEDAEAIAALWAEQGTITNLTTGESTTGRDEILKAVKQFLQTQPQAQLTGEVAEVKLLGDGVAKIHGHTQLALEDGSVEAASYIALLIREGDGWVIESITETSLPLQSAREALSKLEWMVGTWKDDTDEVQVTTSCSWARGDSFLIRKFVVEYDNAVSEGTEIIGWDPQFRQIRSWSFFSDGSFGTGFWTQNGDKWIAQTVHTLANGSIEENLRVVSNIQQDSFQAQLTSQSINGDLHPSQPPVKVIRVEVETANAHEGGE